MNNLVIFGSDRNKRHERRLWELMMSSGNNNNIQYTSFVLDYSSPTKDVVLPYTHKLDYVILRKNFNTHTQFIVNINAVDIGNGQELFNFNRNRDTFTDSYIGIMYYNVEGLSTHVDRTIRFTMTASIAIVNVELIVCMSKAIS